MRDHRRNRPRRAGNYVAGGNDESSVQNHTALTSTLQPSRCSWCGLFMYDIAGFDKQLRFCWGCVSLMAELEGA